MQQNQDHQMSECNEEIQEKNQEIATTPLKKELDLLRTPLLRDLSPFSPLYRNTKKSHNTMVVHSDLAMIETPLANSACKSIIEEVEAKTNTICKLLLWEEEPQEEAEPCPGLDLGFLISEESLQESEHTPQESERGIEVQRPEFNVEGKKAGSIVAKKNLTNSKSSVTKTPSKSMDWLIEAPLVANVRKNVIEKEKKNKKIEKEKSKKREEKIEVNEKKPSSTCNCKKSQCLKLYCDCFREGGICSPECRCIDCHNSASFQEERSNAMLLLLEKNPQVFRSRIEDQQHVKGCNCKKSGCLKKYCECFQAGMPCGVHCKCEECKNGNHEHKEQQNGENKGELIINILHVL